MARSQIPNIILEEEDEDDDNDLPQHSGTATHVESSSSHKINETSLREHTYRHYTTPNRTFAPYERRDSGAVFSKPLLTSVPVLEERSDSSASEESFHDFAIARIEDITLSQMVEITTLSEKQSRFGKSKKFLNRISMMEYVTVQLNLSSSEENVEELKKELEVLAQLRHNNLARFYGYHLSSNHTVTMFRAFMPSGTIADKIKQGPLSEEQALRFYRQTLQGLNYLHNENIIHGNLKCANLLVTLSNQIQLADLSIILVPEPDAHLRRSLLHSAPELLEDRHSLHKTTDATDIWASGCVLVAMLTRFLPFQDQFIMIHSANDLHEKLIAANHPSPQLLYAAETLVPNCSEQLSSILNSIFIRTPSIRPTAAELIEKFFESSTRQVSESFSIRRPTYLKHNDLYDEPEVESPDFYSPDQGLDLGPDSGPQIREVSCCCQWLSFIVSRIWYFVQFTFRSIGMFVLSALSLALVAGTVILTIIVFYKGIGIICGCNLNEGFIVLIALILLPVLILLITLCCNNTMEKFKHSKSESRFVYTRPEHDVILCGVIVIDGKGQRKPSVRRKLATTSEEPGCVDNLPKTAFSRGVAKIA